MGCAGESLLAIDGGEGSEGDLAAEETGGVVELRGEQQDSRCGAGGKKRSSFGVEGDCLVFCCRRQDV